MGHNKNSANRKIHSIDFIKKLERSYTSNLTVHLKALEQKEANIPKRNRQQEILKLRAEINLSRNKENDTKNPQN
jgi:hypothetical protein